MYTYADGYQAAAEGKTEKQKWEKERANGFMDYGQWANLHGSEALSKASPSGQKTLLGDGERVCKVFDHTSSKKESLKLLQGSSFKTMTKSLPLYVLQVN